MFFTGNKNHLFIQEHQQLSPFITLKKKRTMAAAAVVLLSVSSSLDNMSVGVSYAISKRYIDLKCNAAISLLNAIFTLSMMLAGATFVDYVSPDTGSLMASIIFFLLGAFDLKNFAVQMYRYLYNLPQIDPLSALKEEEGDVAVGDEVRNPLLESNDLEAPLLDSDDRKKFISTDSNSSTYTRSRFDSASFDKSGTWTYVNYIQHKLVDTSDKNTAVTSCMTPRTEDISENSEFNQMTDIIITSDTPTNNNQVSDDQECVMLAEKTESFKFSITWTRVTLVQAFIVAWATIFTNIAAGLAAGLAGYSVIWMTVGAFVASFVMLSAGQLIGAVFGGFIPERYLFLTSGLIFWLFAFEDLPYIDFDLY